MSDLKKQAEELGIKVDGRWSDERLQAEIDEKLAEEPAAVPVQVETPVAEPEALPDPVEPEPEPELTAANAEIQADIEARAAALAQEQEEGSIELENLQANPMSALGLASYGKNTLTAVQLADPRTVAKIERALLLGLVRVVK